MYAVYVCTRCTLQFYSSVQYTCVRGLKIVYFRAVPVVITCAARAVNTMYYIFCPFAVGGVLQSPLFPKGTFLWIVLVAEYARVFPVERSAGHTAPFLGTVCVCPGERWRVPNGPLWYSQRNGLSIPTFETLPNAQGNCGSFSISQKLLP